MRTTALAGIAITMQHILSDIIMAVHFALLIVFASRHRLSVCDCFQQLQIEFRCLHNDFTDRQDLTEPLDGCDVLLDFDFDRRSQPAFVLAVYPIVKTWFAITGFFYFVFPAGIPGG